MNLYEAEFHVSVHAQSQEIATDSGNRREADLRLDPGRIPYVLGTALRPSGNPTDASFESRLAGELFEELGKEQGSDPLPNRYDLKPAHGEVDGFVKIARKHTLAG